MIKKSLLLLAIIYCQVVFSAQSDDFVFKVKTDNPGGPDIASYWVPLSSGSAYDILVDCDDDGNIDLQIGPNGGNSLCHYSTSGVYVVRIIDNTTDGTGLDKLDFEDDKKIIELMQWGTAHWKSMEKMFHNATEVVITATDKPDLSAVTSVSYMFRKAEKANPDTTYWDVSQVQDFSFMFDLADVANPNTSLWNTSSATNMASMFKDAHIANPDVSNWNVSQVTNMERMFQYAAAATPDVSNWNTNSLRYISSMFSSAVLAQPDTSTWNTDNLERMTSVFKNASRANPDVSHWNTSKVTRFTSVFEGAISAIPDVTNWNTDLVKDMSYMFSGAVLANPNMEKWNFSAVEKFNAPPGLVAYGFSHMFEGVTLPANTYDKFLIQVSNQNSNPDIRLDMGNSSYCSQPAAIARSNLINTLNWTITDNGSNNCSSSFINDFVMVVKTDNAGSSNDTQFTIPTYQSIVNPGYNYAVDCESDGTYEVLGASADFTCNYATPGTYVIRIVDTSQNLTGFPRIYFNNSGDKLKILDVRQWGKFKWTSMSRAFFGAQNLLVTAEDPPDFSNLVTLSNMFREAHHANPPTSNWNVSNVINMHWMFYRAYNASPNTTHWDTTMVSFFDGMFYEAFSANPDTSGWDTGNATDMGYMFYNAISANPNTASWDITQVASMVNMFKYVTLSIENYDILLSGFATQAVNDNINFHGGYSQYCNALFDRADLMASHSWTITDGGQECTPPAPLFIPEQMTLPPDNTPTIKVACTEVGNVIKIYASDFVGGSIYNNTNIASFTCPAAGIHYFDTPPLLDGTFLMTATESKYGDESLPSPSDDLIIDTVTNAPTSIFVTPENAHNGTWVQIGLAGLEGGATVSIVGMTCTLQNNLPPYPTTCEGTVGVNGFDNSDTTITVTDSYGNVNTDAHYVLNIDNTPPADPSSITTTPLVASTGTLVTTVLEGIELDATVQIPGMTCNPTPADATGTVTCTGVVGQNGLDGSDTVIRIIDLALNANTSNTTGLVVVPDDLIFSSSFD